MDTKFQKIAFSIFISFILFSSSLNENSPLDIRIWEYPYTGTIRVIAKSVNGHIAMSCRNYGWSFDYLVKEKLVDMSEKGLRKIKLMKLNEFK